jgi:hypothetical protein
MPQGNACCIGLTANASQKEIQLFQILILPDKEQSLTIRPLGLHLSEQRKTAQK